PTVVSSILNRMDVSFLKFGHHDVLTFVTLSSFTISNSHGLSSDRAASSAFVRRLQAHEGPLLGPIFAEIHDHRRFGLRKVPDARSVDGVLLIADNPRRSLRLFVY